MHPNEDAPPAPTPRAGLLARLVRAWAPPPAGREHHVPGLSARSRHGGLLVRVRYLAFHVVAFWGAWAFGVTAEAVAIAVAFYALRMWAVTAGYHRYFSHRSFKTGRVFQFVLAFLSETSVQRGVIWWARNHRHHHRTSDTPADLHSPVAHSLWTAHVGWLFDPANEEWRDTVRDLERYPELRWLDAHWMVPPVAMGAVAFLLAGWPGLFVGFMLSTVATWHATFTINSLCHVWGWRRYDTPDQSRNNLWLALLTFGEGWHNNHHHDMRACRQGRTWKEIDITWMVLRLLERLGIVWDLREPKDEVPARRAA